MSDRTLPTTTSQNQYWPCDTPEGLDLFTFLSGSKVSNTIREGVGTRLKKHGFLETNEFAIAEKRLREFPKAEWTKTRISEESWGERIDVRCRSVLELFLIAHRNPKCDPSKMVWGPELECDDDTDRFGYNADLCNGPW